MTEVKEAPTQKPRTVVLDAEQEYAWAVEATRSVFPMLAIELAGHFEQQAWEEAYKQVQQRYPLLSGHIEKELGSRPRLVLDPGQLLHLTYVESSVSNDLLAFMQDEAKHSFGLGKESLAHLTIYDDGHSTCLLFSAHHAICDGYTNVSIVRDLIFAAKGGVLGPRYPVLPTMGEMLGIGPPQPYVQTLTTLPVPDCGELSIPPGHMDLLRFEVGAFNRVRDRAKKEEATIQGTLIAALYLAGKELSPKWQSQPVICLTPADLRPLLDLGTQPGVLLSTLPTILQPEAPLSFWPLARQVSAELHSARTVEHARQGQTYLRETFKNEVDPCRRETIDVSGFRHDLMVTNLGILDHLLGDLEPEVQSAFQSVFSGTSDDAQIVSALSLHGTLFLHHASRQPIAGLLERTKTLLVTADAD